MKRNNENSSSFHLVAAGNVIKEIIISRKRRWEVIISICKSGDIKHLLQNAHKDPLCTNHYLLHLKLLRDFPGEVGQWHAEIILCMRPGNERRCYTVTLSFIGWYTEWFLPYPGWIWIVLIIHSEQAFFSHHKEVFPVTAPSQCLRDCTICINVSVSLKNGFSTRRVCWSHSCLPWISVQLFAQYVNYPPPPPPHTPPHPPPPSPHPPPHPHPPTPFP